MLNESCACKEAGRASHNDGKSQGTRFAGTMSGLVYVGEDLPYEVLPWYAKKGFTLVCFTVLGLASAAIVTCLLTSGYAELIERGHDLGYGIIFWELLFWVAWLGCYLHNVVRLLRSGKRGVRAFDLVAGSVMPSLVSGGVNSSALFLLASPIAAALIGALAIGSTVGALKGETDEQLETTCARWLEVGATAGALMLIAFCLFSADWGF